MDKSRYLTDSPVINIDVSALGQVQLNIYGEQSKDLLCGLHLAPGDAETMANAILVAAMQARMAGEEN